MKRYILVFFMAIWISPACEAAGVFVQGKGNIKGSSTTNAVAFTSNETVGNTLVLVTINDGGGVTVSGVTDSAGNGWTKGTSKLFQFSTKDFEMWYSTNCKAGANTVTVTYGGTVDSAVIIAEYQNPITSSNPFDKSAVNSTADGAPTTAPDSGNTATTVTANELLIGGTGDCNNTNQTWTAGSGYTVQVSTTFLGGFFCNAALEDKSVTATGAYNANFTLGTSDQWAAGIMTFQLPGSPATAPVSRGLLISGARVNIL